MAGLTLLPRCCQLHFHAAERRAATTGHEELDRGADRVVGGVDVAEGQEGAERRVPVVRCGCGSVTGFGESPWARRTGTARRGTCRRRRRRGCSGRPVPRPGRCRSRSAPATGARPWLRGRAARRRPRRSLVGRGGTTRRAPTWPARRAGSAGPGSRNGGVSSPTQNSGSGEKPACSTQVVQRTAGDGDDRGAWHRGSRCGRR